MLMIAWNIFVLVAISPSASGLTELQEVVSGVKTLTKQDSPYGAQDGLNIAEGATLQVEAGVEVQFAPGKGLDVHGNLVLQGDAPNPVTFTIWEEKRIPWSPPNITLPIRLSDAEDTFEDQGVLEVKSGDTWVTVCDSRASDPNRHGTWIGQTARVICRDLGFALSSSAFLSSSSNPPTKGSRYSTLYDCDETHTHLDECPTRRGWCDYGRFTIHVNCESTKPGSHWGGITYHNTSSSRTTSYINVFYGGVHFNGNDSVLVHAVQSRRVPIAMSNLVIENSGGHGIGMEDIDESIRMENIRVTGSRLDGINLTTQHETGRLNNLRLEGNRNGLIMDRLDVGDFSGEDFCSITCVRCQHTLDEFPLRFNWTKPAGQNIDCTKVFSTVAGNVILLRPIKATYHIFISIRDGDHIDSPIIYQGNLANGQLSQPMPAIVTQSDTITIKITSTHYRYLQYLYFELHSGPPGSFGLYFNDILSQDNQNSGIWLANIRMPMTISKITTTNNTEGVKLESVSSIVTMRGISTLGNHQTGISLENAEGFISMSNINASDNQISGITYRHAKACDQFSVAHRYATVLTITHAALLNNGQKGVNVETGCRVNISISESNISGGTSGISSLLNYNRGQETSNVYIRRNNMTVLPSDAVKVNGYSSVLIEIQENTFSIGNYSSVNINLVGGSSRPVLVYLIGNLFQHIQSPISVVYINVPRYREDSREYIIRNNVFKDVSMPDFDSFQLHHRIHAYTSSVVYLKTKANVTVTGNFFDIQTPAVFLYAGDEDTNLIHNAKLNYWGSTDINEISDRIYGYHQNILLAHVTYVPYLLSKDINDKSTNDMEYPDFVQGANIGGVFNTRESLTDTSKPYHVVKDIVVSPNASLDIGPGVTLLFEYGKSMLVFGKLSIHGDQQNPVTMDALPGTPNDVKIHGGPSSLEGFVQVYHNNTWYYLCYSNLGYATLDILCAESGGSARRKNSEAKPGNFTGPHLSTVSCEDYFGKCTMGDTVQQCNQYQYLTCLERHWSGLHLAVDAKPATIKHVTIDRYGQTTKSASSAMLIEFFNHDISYIKMLGHINATEVTGIKILRTDAVEIPVLQNIEIFKTYGHGIISYNSRLGITNVSMNNTLRNNIAIYVKEEIPALPTLREGITEPMCSQETLQLEVDEVRFLDVDDLVISRGTNCSVYITTTNNHNIAVQVINGGIPDCGKTTLLFYDGHKNDSESHNLRAENNGMIWRSSGNSTHLVMRRHYHYRYRCMKIYLRVWVVADDAKSEESLFITDTSIQGFQTGLSLTNIMTPVVLTRTTFNNCEAGIAYSSSNTNVSLNACKFTNTKNALQFHYNYGQVHVVSTIFESSDVGIGIVYGQNNAEDASVQVGDCHFSGNRIALHSTGRGYRNYFKNIAITVGDSTFDGNNEIMLVTVGRKDSNGYAMLNFFNNTIKSSQRGISFDSVDHEHSFKVQNNTFLDGDDGAVLSIQGQVEFTDNIVSNWSYTGGSLVNINHQQSQCEIEVSNNVISNNRLSQKVVSLSSRCENTTVSGNIMENNIVQLDVLDIAAYKDDGLKTKTTIVANRFVGNQAGSSNQCVPSSTLVFSGFRHIMATKNILENPQLKFEVFVNQLTQNQSSTVSMPYNYFGTTDPKELGQKIYDGRYRHDVPLANIVPYYVSEEMNIESMSEPLNDFLLPNSKLGGRMLSSVTLRENHQYVATSDIIIPSNITLRLPPGTVLEVLPSVSIFIYGTLDAVGSVSAPVVIRKSTLLASDDDPCNAQIRIIPDQPTNKLKGRLEVFGNRIWSGVCNTGWGMEDSHVACRQLGYESAVRFYIIYTSRVAPVPSYDCIGSEDNLRHCPFHLATRNCYSVGLQCSEVQRGTILHFLSRNNSEISVLRNVVFDSIRMIQVSGTPPKFENVIANNTQQGLLYLGAGIVKEVDVNLKNTSILNSSKSGIILFDITSNVTLEENFIEGIPEDGIFFSPTVDDSKVTADHSLVLSTFRFCDTEPVLFIYPGEEYKFFSGRAQGLTGCRRMFQTDPSYSIMLGIHATWNSRSSTEVASFYEGDMIKEENKIRTVSFISHTQNATIQSWENIMAVKLHQKENFINYAYVTSVPKRANDCSFEDGDCGWRNYESVVSVEWGNWTIFSPADGEAKDFKGLQNDVTFPGGKEGHYIYVGDGHGQSCNRNDYYRASSKDAVMQGPKLFRTNNICEVSFYHFRSITYTFRGDALKLYVNDGKSLTLLWSSTAAGSYDRWLNARVKLDQIRTDSYSLLFHARYVTGCPNSVGIDDIKFLQCPKEKLVSTISLRNVKFQNVMRRPVWIKNSDPNKHNVVWIERCSIKDSISSQEQVPTVGLRLKSAYVLIRNTDVSNVKGRTIDIEFDSETRNRVAEVTLAQNTLRSSARNGVVLVQNTGVKESMVWLVNNDIQQNTASDNSSVIQVINASLVMDANLIYNNTGRYILQLGGDNPGIGNVLDQNITSNIFWFNVAQQAAAKYTVLANASSVWFNENLLNNPTNAYEFSGTTGTPSPSTIDCSSNWWGSGQPDQIRAKLRSSANTQGLPSVTYRPFWTYPPSKFGISSSCPVGWSRQGSRCMLYRGGAVGYSQAIRECEALGATMLSTNLVNPNRKFLSSTTQYRDVDGSSKNAIIWIELSTNVFSVASTSVTDSCHVYMPHNDTKASSRCNLLRPYICEKFSVVLCKNSCFQNGICSGKTCVCHKGWQGDDCSKFHCKDVNDCSGRGTCVGPNQCKCRPGWQGRACSKSYCSRFDSCLQCSKRTGCGWCDSSHLCIPGNGFGSDIGNCENWFYYKCLTIGADRACSQQIYPIECDSRYCDKNNTETNPGLCQECEDVQNCYDSLKPDLPNNATCPTWDEDKCPQGVVSRNYSDPNRIENTVLADDVIYIDPSDLLIYFCPVLVDKDSEDLNVYIIREDRRWQSGAILSSPQAGGIFTRINRVIPLEKGLVMLFGQAASITDMIKYADFKDEDVPFQNIGDKLTQDQAPQDYLLRLYVNDSLEVNDSTTFYTLPRQSVMKCVGHEYRDSNGTTIFSYFVVVPVTQDTSKYTVGDVLVSTFTKGYLETVENITSTKYGTFVFTKLTQCSNNNMNINLKTDQKFGDMTGEAGDSWPGLIFYNSSKEFSAQIGDSVIGRRASGVFGKVISRSQRGNFVFLEMISVETIEKGRVVTPEVGSLSMVRRRKRSTVTLSESGSGQLSYSGPGFSVSAKASYSASLKLTLKVSWDWFDTTLEEAGWTLTGKISNKLELSANLEKKFSKSGPIGDYRSPDVGKFFIYLIPGRVFFDVSAGYELTVSAKASLTVSQTQESSVTVGSRYTRSSGIRSDPPKKTSGESRDIQAKLEGVASAALKVNPQIRIQWPLWYGTKDKGRGRRGEDDDSNTYDDLSVSDEEKKALDLLPGDLKAEAEAKACIEAGGKYCVKSKVTGEGAVRDELTSLEVAFRLPMSLTAAAKACDTDCKDPDSQTSLSICGKVDAFQVAFAALVWEYVVSLKLDVGPCARKCSSNLVPCCLCEDDDGQLKPGKLDPKTKECLCPCFCDPPDNTIKSVKKKGEECKCEECPDGSIKRWYQDIKCPCTCPDEPDKEKEMEDDGTCDCPCTCEDGSKDQLDANGQCPCECECKNCQKSTLGPDGCKCPDDVCPVCESGAQAEWKDCKCECPENPCGEPPACASGRTGAKCELPHCPACPSCSGNGVCTAASGSCASSCQCSPQWMGSCCEQRRPANRSGDPHIDTLDGVPFDYFGIGQFWDCYSEVNDFGYQVRFFYYGQTSFTGAVAIKAGQSVVTVTTRNPATVKDMPFFRLNGEIKNISADWTTMIGANQVKVDVSHNTQGGEDTGVVIVSLQFKNGASISLDIRYSPKMRRQYINIQFALTADFKLQTSGLCGFMDDDMENDLMGPDGVLYNSTEQFVESWRIQPMVRNGGGLSGSWSWTQSNFHPDDPLDISYTDPNFVPSYSLDGFSRADIYAATMLCSSRRLTGTLLDGCIYDVVITNDTTFTFQEILKTGCPNQCSGKGRCVNSVCQCAAGWSGEDCSIGSCGRCVNGRCESGFCQCDIGWETDDCSHKATCYGVKNCTDADHGQCLTTDKCLCKDGYIGSDCSIIPTCYNVANCSQQGICVDYDKCKCHLGYTGPSCQQFSCEILQHCSGNGLCVDLDVCLCKAGWTGINCGMPDCKDVNQCSGYGTCVSPGTCECMAGFSGKDCSVKERCPKLDDCNDQGVCMVSLMETENGTSSTIVCKCDFGYSGENCSEVLCDNNCSGHGQCVEPNLCQCDEGYTGPDCSAFSCETKAGCSGHGNCIRFETCDCEVGWSGEQCDVAECDGVNGCSNQGFCITPDTCECYDGFQGQTCDQALEENLHSPVLNVTEFNVTIRENTAAGKILAIVAATDEDDGDNGVIRYSLDLAGAEFDLGNYLVIDNIGGVVILVKPIPRSLVPSGQVEFVVVASDKGIPSRTAEASFQLTIEDINDNCPVFIEPSNGAEIFVNASSPGNTTLLTVYAEDADFGKNGEVTYNFARAQFTSTGLFYLDKYSGELVTTGPLPVKKYTLDIMATDMAETPCSAEIKIFVTVYPSDAPSVIVITTTKAPTTTSVLSTSTLPTTPSTQKTPSLNPSSTSSTSSTKSQNTTMNITTEATGLSSTVTSEITTRLTTISQNDKTSEPPKDSSKDKLVAILGGVLGAVALIALIIIISLACALHKAKERAARSKYSYENEMPEYNFANT